MSLFFEDVLTLLRDGGVLIGMELVAGRRLLERALTPEKLEIMQRFRRGDL